uniref:Uncharacterized protein n=1 Tax=Timema tahoe TaxID=61484 RepID=A0A7R9FL87_9NEOP|nr:unnamed protein product [Timema tahoe]
MALSYSYTLVEQSKVSALTDYTMALSYKLHHSETEQRTVRMEPGSLSVPYHSFTGTVRMEPGSLSVPYHSFTGTVRMETGSLSVPYHSFTGTVRMETGFLSVPYHSFTGTDAPQVVRESDTSASFGARNFEVTNRIPSSIKTGRAKEGQNVLRMCKLRGENRARKQGFATRRVTLCNIRQEGASIVQTCLPLSKHPLSPPDTTLSPPYTPLSPPDTPLYPFQTPPCLNTYLSPPHKVVGRPGVDSHVRHDSEAAVVQIQFLVNEGALITATADDSLHLWNFRQKRPEVVHSLKFQRERQKRSCTASSSRERDRRGRAQPQVPERETEEVVHSLKFQRERQKRSCTASSSRERDRRGRAQPQVPERETEEVVHSLKFQRERYEIILDSSLQTEEVVHSIKFQRERYEIILDGSLQTEEVVHSIKFQRERITYIHLPLQSKWLYVGTEKGNIHVVNIESFVLSGYVINWNKAIEYEPLESSSGDFSQDIRPLKAPLRPDYRVSFSAAIILSKQHNHVTFLQMNVQSEFMMAALIRLRLSFISGGKYV